MKATQLREKTADELREAHDEARQSLFDLQVRTNSGEGAEQPLKARSLRREVARINTVIRQRELEGVKNHG